MQDGAWDLSLDGNPLGLHGGGFQRKAGHLKVFKQA